MFWVILKKKKNEMKKKVKKKAKCKIRMSCGKTSCTLTLGCSLKSQIREMQYSYFVDIFRKKFLNRLFPAKY